MEQHPEEINHSEIVVSGPRRDEYAPAVYALLAGKLPPDWEWVNSSTNSIVARCLKLSPVYYKEFLSRSPFERIKSLVRGSRCLKARVRGEILRRKGFRSPSVYCWGSKGHRHFMITEGINAVGLTDYIYKHWQPPLSRDELLTKRRLIEKFGEEIGKLHQSGICHGDLRLNNILVEQTEDDPVFYFIDNERNSFFRRIPKRRIEKNLVQVNMINSTHVTRQDRLRFFRAYSETYLRFSPAEKLALLERVQEKTLERLAKKIDRS